MFLIRKAEETDIPDLEEIIPLLFPKGRFQNSEDDSYLVADNDGEIIGFCHYKIKEGTCYIGGLGVLPQFRNQGTGTRLMEKVLEIADNSGVQTTLLKVRALNHAASLYLHFGFFEKMIGETITLVRKRPS